MSPLLPLLSLDVESSCLGTNGVHNRSDASHALAFGSESLTVLKLACHDSDGLSKTCNDAYPIAAICDASTRLTSEKGRIAGWLQWAFWVLRWGDLSAGVMQLVCAVLFCAALPAFAQNTQQTIQHVTQYHIGHELGFGVPAIDDAVPSTVTPAMVDRLRREASSGKKGTENITLFITFLSNFCSQMLNITLVLFYITATV